MRRSLPVFEEFQIASEGLVNLDEGKITVAVVLGGEPLSGSNTALGVPGLDAGLSDGSLAPIANVALDDGSFA